jgi:hypothetical protein
MKKLQVVQEKISNNRIIEHTCEVPTLLITKCPCCQEDFYFILYPNIFEYPKYCPKHSNPYKRSIL